jgi:hypothetical protein
MKLTKKEFRDFLRTGKQFGTETFLLDGSNLLEQLPNISRTPANIIQSVSIIFNGSNDKNNFLQFSLHFGEISKTF